ncbi:MAG: glycosyltransferase family 39 protein [Anaerolineaceae bacterium]|nr:glycosyltransferase family 39 protein [Anaerolineaceae bacterium]
MSCTSKSLIKTHLVTLLVVLTLLLGWTLRLYQLGTRSFQYEEGYAVYIANLTPAETSFWSSRDLVPPSHSYLLASWMTLTGQSEFAARFLSTAAGILTVAVFIRLGKEQSTLAGLVAGLLAALSPFYVWHSQYARMYALLALFGSAATLVLTQALREPSRKRLWVAFAVLEALALYTQTTAVFLILFHVLAIVYVGVWSENSTVWKRGGMALAGVVLAWLPWLLYALPFFGTNAGFWPGKLDATLVVSESFQAFVGGQVLDSTTRVIAVVIWGLGCLLGFVMLMLHRKWGQAAFLLGWLIVPVAMLAILFRRLPKFEPRYLIFASPPIILLSVLGLEKVFHRRDVWRYLAGLAVAAMMIISGIGLGNLFFVPEFSEPDFRAAVQMVQKQIGPNEGVVLVPGYAFPVWEYYYDSENWEALPDDPILDVRNVLHYPVVVPHLNEWLDNYEGVWLVQWSSDIIDPTGIVPYLMERVAEKTPVTGASPNGICVEHYRFNDGQPLPAKPEVLAPQPYVLSLPLQLDGCNAHRDNKGVDVACYWQADSSLPEHLAVSARLFDESGNLVAAEDVPLIAGRSPGVPVLARHFLPCESCPPASYWLTLDVYDYTGKEYGAAMVGPLDLR